MKMIPVKKSILKRVALSVLVVSMHSAMPMVENNNHEANLTSLNIAGSFIHNIDKHFVDLVNTNIKAPLNTFLGSIGKTIQDLKQKGDAIKRSNDPTTVRLHELFEYVIRKFNIA